MGSEEKEKSEKDLEAAWNEAKRIVSEVKYGSVTLVIQDGVIVQIERQEKLRLK